MVDKVSEISNTTLSVIEDKSKSKENELNRLEREKLIFPLNNSNVNLLTTTYGQNQNNLVNNTMFVEFEVSNLEKNIEGQENENCFCSVDSNYVNKEIEYLLNVINYYLMKRHQYMAINCLVLTLALKLKLKTSLKAFKRELKHISGNFSKNKLGFRRIILQ